MSSLYRQVMGSQFDKLAPELRKLHDQVTSQIFHGHCDIQPAESRIARCICRMMRLPTREACDAFTFELRLLPGQEIWLRHFPHKLMRSTMCVESGQLIERFGVVKFKFNLAADKNALTMNLIGISVCGISLPRRWLPNLWGREHGANGKFYFDAGASWGRLGRLVAYTGWLEIV